MTCGRTSVKLVFWKGPRVADDHKQVDAYVDMKVYTSLD